MSVLRLLLIVVAFVIGTEIGSCIIRDVEAAQHGLIFEGVVLEDGATDGSEGYYKIGNDLIFVAKPGSYELTQLEPLKGKRVRFAITPE